MIDLTNYNKDTSYLCLSKLELTEIPDLSYFSNLVHLDLSVNYITKINNIPITVKTLIINNNNLSEINNLHEGLEMLSCYYNQITYIQLPKSIISCVCNYNDISNIDHLYNLPNLITLWCSYNLIKGVIKKLPPNLISFDCSHNYITTINNLPNSIKTFKCNNNYILFFPYLPTNITDYNFHHNKLPSCNYNDLLSYIHKWQNAALRIQNFWDHYWCNPNRYIIYNNNIVQISKSQLYYYNQLHNNY